MTHKKFAVKFFLYSFNDVKEVNFLYKEINVLKELKHSGIVKLFSYCEAKNNKLALIFEYLSGDTLRHFILNQPLKRLDENTTRNILEQILKTLLFCHEQNIIHHDLKTENILFTDESHTKIKIIDFGISSLINSSCKAGSLIYLPPEVVNKTNIQSLPSVDVWSIGCIFGEMLSGKRIFENKNIKKIKSNIINGVYENKLKGGEDGDKEEYKISFEA